MVRPFGRWMINGRIAYVVLFVVTYLLSLFFCPHLLSRSSVPCCSRRRSRPGCRRSALIALAISGQGVALEHCATHFVDGLVHAFKAMGIILPVAGFVYPGIPDYSGSILGLEDGTGPAFLFDAVESIQTRIPDNGLFAAFSMILIGMLIGLDGSGWAGLPLTGGTAAALAPQTGTDTATLAALAQNAATWTGGGTRVIWSSLIVVAGFCRVPVGDLVRRLAIPVVSGLLVAAVAASTSPPPSP
ncbi:hypothetical protein Y013_06410 [Rhodococcus pyridinivorans SB3094]|uniref:Uncharacterized protein n=1 Tax=Rhodococcus pyridinivorans SB3094 TaxID=1435356 RepID=V9XNU0_9NOCA|nr:MULTISPECIES: hypothetical protein [Rhodococcus]AHD23655.1 hypothetical protein Y013_06410 [Rhodococcus pyridinivorans SB3094]MCT7292905.1 hypothetical protein [Rhodococcus sp. PAE-6]